MNPLRLLQSVFLSALVVTAAVPGLKLTIEEEKHVIGDPKVTEFVYFDVRVYKSTEDFEDWGQLKFALFGERLPITTNFFIDTAKMETGGYSQSLIHRVAKDVMFQGGHHGRKGFKQYQVIPYEKFKQESFEIKHTRKGRISLASTGGDTNACSYFITVGESAPFFDGKYVVFGQLVDGFALLDKINNMPLKGDEPAWEVVVHKASVGSAAPPLVAVYMDHVTKNYTYLVWGCVGLALVFLAYRYKKGSRGGDTKVFKM